MFFETILKTRGVQKAAEKMNEDIMVRGMNE